MTAEQESLRIKAKDQEAGLFDEVFRYQALSLLETAPRMDGVDNPWDAESLTETLRQMFAEHHDAKDTEVFAFLDLVQIDGVSEYWLDVEIFAKWWSKGEMSVMSTSYMDVPAPGMIAPQISTPGLKDQYFQRVHATISKPPIQIFPLQPLPQQ